MSYIKCGVEQFEKVMRIYLDNRPNTFSYISGNLIERLCPEAIEEDEDRCFAILDLIIKNIHGETDVMTVTFQILETPGFEFTMAEDVLKDFDHYEDCIVFKNGATKIYHSSQ